MIIPIYSSINNGGGYVPHAIEAIITTMYLALILWAILGYLFYRKKYQLREFFEIDPLESENSSATFRNMIFLMLTGIVLLFSASSFVLNHWPKTKEDIKREKFKIVMDKIDSLENYSDSTSRKKEDSLMRTKDYQPY